ncbi:MAG: hypothetical protein KJZ90_01570 [Rhodocyclaceae bacterium]|nr:hypothetical protein [Rhodocyclaceae bacterium]
MNTAAQTRNVESPRLWIKRMVLFASPEQHNAPLREIPFHRGLNIVWGVELPDDAGIDAAHPVTLSGHSVGKTTCCRLIRYCLGESTFGNPAAMARIRHTFPDGWVGLELAAGDQEWSVLKPLGRSGDPKAAQGLAIEALFALDRKQNQFSAFSDHLRGTLMANLQAYTPPGSAKPYQWRHLLAWLARDQEARFQSLHDWRSPRSGSETPKFEKPKEHALYLVRLVLDIVQEEELRISRALSEAEEELEQLESRIGELRREPEYARNEQERALKQLFGLSSEDALSINESDLMSPVVIRRTELHNAIASLQNEIDTLDRRIAEKRVWLASYDQQRQRFRDAMETTDEAIEHAESAEVEDETIRKLRALRGKDCTYGNVPFAECSYVRGRLDKAGKVVDLQQVREDRRVASETQSRLLILEQQHKDHDEIVALLDGLQKKLDRDVADKRAKEVQLAERREQLQRLNQHLVQRQLAQDLIDGRAPNTELEQKAVRAAEQKALVEQQSQELARLQASHGMRLQGIGVIYDGLIKSALSDTYSGALRMTKGELQFQIEEAAGLSGEAVETLALVLADVAAMMCSCQGIGHHPRFLMHDSPREADLDRHIYNRYLRTVMALSTENGGAEAAPFQYIVTTTSRPPEDLQSAICLQLEAHPQTSMLFRCVLRNPEVPHTSDLFATPGEA